MRTNCRPAGYRCYGASGDDIASIGKLLNKRWLHRRRYQPSRWSPSMRKPKKQKKPLNDLSRSLTPFDPNRTLIGVIELGKESWLVAGIVPGVERQPLKKLPADQNDLLKLLERWRGEAEKAGHKINRIAVAFEAGRDGFWLARWLRARGIEAHVIHAASVAVSREHRRAKTDRLDTEQLKRAFLGWLRGERNHCKMCAIPTIAEEDAKRPHRERETLVGQQTTIVNRVEATLARLGIRSFNPKLKKAPERLEHLRTPEGEPIPPNTLAELQRDLARKQLIVEQIREIEKERLEQLKRAPKTGPNLMVLVLMCDRHWHRDGGHAGQGDPVAEPARPPRRGALRRAHGLARRKRKVTPREGACPIRQRSSTERDDPARLALPRLPKGERPGQVVPSSHRDRTWLAQEDDRGLGAQAAHRPVAPWARRRGTPGRHSPSSTLKGGRAQATPDGFGLSAQTCDRSPMTVRGGGVPVRCMASNAVPQNGSAASELAADAYPCIMVWVFGPAAYKDVARVFVHLPAARLDV